MDKSVIASSVSVRASTIKKILRDGLVSRTVASFNSFPILPLHLLLLSVAPSRIVIRCRRGSSFVSHAQTS